MWRFSLVLAASTQAHGLTINQINPEPTVNWGLILSLVGLIGLLLAAGIVLLIKLRRTKAELAHQREQMDAISDSLLVIDKQACILEIAHTLYVGKAPFNLLGTHVMDHLSDEQCHHFLHHLQLAFEENNSRSFRLDADFDGRELNLLCRLSVLPSNPTKAYMVITDVTRFKEAERTLERARKQAEELAQARAGFLANMSHELRTPLSGIVGMVSLLEDAVEDADLTQYTQPLLSSVDHLRRIVDDVLELAKADGGNIVLEERDLCLWQILDDLEGLFAQQAQSRGVEFEVVSASQVPRYVHIDGFRLRQVLYNLVGNAVKFTEEGRIRLEIGVRQLAHRTFLHFAVADTGIGIDNAQQQGIFDAFRQADASTARQHGGTGLGLSICKKLVELMGGVLEVQSELGSGSTFWFTVPLQVVADKDDVSYWQARGVNVDVHQEAERQWMQQFFNGLGIPQQKDAALLVTDHLKQAGQAQWVWWLGQEPEVEESTVLCLQSPLRRMVLLNRLLSDQAPKEEQQLNTPKGTGQIMEQHILIVEDNPTNELVLRRMLEKMGYKASSASNGKEGVERWAEGQFDAIIMDVQMPIMDGIDATRSIRQQEQGNYTPIIALTANAQKSIEEACFSAGTDAFLTKPVDRSQLQNTLAAVLGGHKVSTSA